MDPFKISRSNSTFNYFQQLVRFGKQTPRLLRIQNIVSLLSSEVLFSQQQTKSSLPSIERFHCSLLFADISGFTKLSQELALDDLEIHINAYFKMILEIIAKYDGEVVKFVGDAIFVIWQCHNSQEDILLSLNLAIRCGIEINKKCSNYRILIDYSNSLVAAKLRRQQSVLTTVFSSNSSQANPMSHYREYFLNIHSSVSTGTLAGVDIGCQDRWEYFLIGKPLDDVALAAGDAKKGELVLSPISHNLFHPDSITDLPQQDRFISTDDTKGNDSIENPKRTNSLRESVCRCSCNCVLTASGCYRIDDINENTEEVVILPPPITSNIEDDDDNFKLYKMLLQEIFDTFAVFTRKLEDNYDLVIDYTKDSLLDKYLSFCQQMLLQQLVRHTHEANRINFQLEENINENFHGFITFLEQVITNTKSPFHLDNLPHLVSSSKCISSGNISSIQSSPQSFIQANTSVVKKMREITSMYRNISNIFDSSSDNNDLHGDSLTAELRRVVTLFIRLDLSQLTLEFESHTSPPVSSAQDSTVSISPVPTLTHKRHVSINAVNPSPRDVRSNWYSQFPNYSRRHARSKSIIPSDFCFLQRSEKELESDRILLQQYQTCMNIIITELSREGGQLRQFIVDDKGTICMATFGLRGSVHQDGAAAAVETARNILSQLKLHGIGAAVGITSGKVYCGNVGSSMRHEYTILGPSVNLSARLMSKAKVGEIICDEQIRNEDRNHKFQRLAAVQAKGYAQPVPTFRPVFKSSTTNILSTEADKSPVQEMTIELGDDVIGLFEKPKDFHAIFNFLISVTETWKIMNHLPNFIQSTLEKSLPFELLDSLIPSETIFQEDLSCKMVLVSGASGLGKSHLLYLFRDRLSYMCNAHSACNITILFARCNNFNSSDQFYVWKRIFFKLMQRFSEEIDDEGQEQEVSSEVSLVDAILARLPNNEQQNWKPLLKAVNLAIDTPDNDITAKLVGQDRIVATVSLLGAIIQLYSRLSSKLIFFIIDDIHGMDSASKLLLQYIYIYTQGICILGAERMAAAVTTQGILSFCHKNSLEEALFILEKRNAALVTNSNDCKRVMLSELLPLDYVETAQMIQHILTTNSFTDCSDLDALFDRVYSLSGGNPLYISELMTLALHINQSNQQQLLKIIGKLRPKRIEEVISYRFDQLEENMRLVLKMASVAAYRGPMFNLSLLKYMFLKKNILLSQLSGKYVSEKQTTVGSESSSVAPSAVAAVDLVEIIQSLLTTKEFIKMHSIGTNSLVTSGYSTPNILHQDLALAINQFELSYWEGMEFEFITSIELTTIYEMMLDTQRTALHLHVAVYLEEEIELNKSPSYNRYNRIASHYHLAKTYHKSVVWYYRAALLLESSGAFQECQKDLMEAYIMFMMMKKEAGFNVSEPEISGAFCTLQSFSYLSSSVALAPVAGIVATNDAMPTTRKHSKVLSDAELYNLFQGDANLLEIVLRMLAKLAQFCFVQGEDVSVVSNIYDEALQLLTACCALTPNKSRDNFDRELGNRLVLNNDLSFVFPILHGISRQYFSGGIPDPGHKKDLAVCAIFLEIAESTPLYVLHQIVARFTFGYALQEAGRFEEAVAVFDPILSTYDVIGHANQMIKMYSFNHILAHVAVNVKRLLLLGDLKSAEEQLDYILLRIDKIQHNDSYSFIAHAVCNALVLLGRPEEAVQQYLAFLTAVANNGGALYMFADFRVMHLYWLQLAWKGYSTIPLYCPKDADPVNLNFMDKEKEKEKELNSQLSNKGYFAPNMKWTSMQKAFSLFSRGIENVSAEIHLHYATCGNSSDNNPIKYAQKALENVNLCIDNIDISSSSLFILCYFQSCLLKVRILLLLNDYGVDSNGNTIVEQSENQHMEAVISILEHCWSLAYKRNLVFICLCIGDFYIQLNLNGERGKEILRMGMEILEHRKDFDENMLEKWKKMIQSLNKL